MESRKLEATVVVENAHTGSLICFGASHPAKLNIGTAVLPLSTVKLLVAASFLEHEQYGEVKFPNAADLLRDSIAYSSDDAGRRLAEFLRESLGASSVLDDLARYGFERCTTTNERSDFSREPAPRWRDTLMPSTVCHSLGKPLKLNQCSPAKLLPTHLISWSWTINRSWLRSWRSILKVIGIV